MDQLLSETLWIYPKMNFQLHEDEIGVGLDMRVKNEKTFLNK